MNNKILISIVVIIAVIQAQAPKINQMERGLRDSGKYFAWVYFTDKDAENIGKNN